MTDREASQSGSADPRDVFVVHGRDGRVRDSLFAFLRSLGLRPIEWSHAVELSGKSSPYVGEVLDAAFTKAQAVVILLTGDDEARLRDDLRAPHDPAFEAELTPQARPNVLFEAGLAFGRHPERTIIVEVGALRPFSDIAGRYVIRLDDSTEKRQALAQRLLAARCQVDMTGTDWHRTGDFKPSAAPSPGVPSTAGVAPTRLHRLFTSLSPIVPSSPTPGPGDWSARVDFHDISMPGPIAVLSFSGRIVQPGSSHSTVAWRLALRNNGPHQKRVFGEFQFRDADGYPIETSPFSSSGFLQPGEERVFTGTRFLANEIIERCHEVVIDLNP